MPVMRPTVLTIRLNQNDLAAIEKLKEQTGIQSANEVIRAGLRAHLRELGLSVPAAAVQPKTGTEG